MQLTASVSACLRARSSASVRGSRVAAPQSPARRSLAKSVRVRAGLVQQLTAEQLEVAILERDRPLVIDFFAR